MILKKRLPKIDDEIDTLNQKELNGFTDDEVRGRAIAISRKQVSHTVKREKLIEFNRVGMGGLLKIYATLCTVRKFMYRIYMWCKKTSSGAVRADGFA